jgi:hypothetical protein
MENRPLRRRAAVCAEHQPQRVRLLTRVIGIPGVGRLPTLLRLASEAQSRSVLVSRPARRRPIQTNSNQFRLNQTKK